MTKDTALPSTEDMKALMAYLNTEFKKRTETVQSSCSKKAYNDLAKVTSIFLMVFNKRRGNETVKMKVSDYTERTEDSQNETVMASLTQVEKGLMKIMTLAKTFGKRGRVVPVLIPECAKDAIETLLSAREAVGVPLECPLLFAKVNGKRLSGWHSLQSLCKLAGVKNSKYITATNMRKYLATIAQVMNLRENEMDMIASHLGHDLAVHRRYYRLQDSTIELSKIARLLMSTESRLGEFDDRESGSE